MALKVSNWEKALETKLKAIFENMHSEDGSKDDDWFAKQLASAIASTGTDHIKTAGIPASSVIVSVTGQATGMPNIAEINVE